MVWGLVTAHDGKKGGQGRHIGGSKLAECGDDGWSPLREGTAKRKGRKRIGWVYGYGSLLSTLLDKFEATGSVFLYSIRT